MIVVFGSINIDQVYQMTALPVGGETVLADGYIQVPGGKGANQALAARRAGADVHMAGCVGADANADPALALLRNDGVGLDAVVATDRPTGCASIWVAADAENSIVVSSGANKAAISEQVPQDFLNKKDILLLQMEIPAQENWRLLARARAEGMTTLLNLAPASDLPKSALHDLDYLIVNEGEAARVAAQYGLQHLKPVDLAARLSADYDLCCVLTLGPSGAVAVKDGDLLSVDAFAVEAVDTTAAGDSFIGAFAAALDDGSSLHTALEYASATAALACMGMGAQSSIPYQKSVLGFLAHQTK